ncbi:hypothetical protein IJJ08_01270 [bacterium]|nr:hypothetical protein [bacterium]
MTKCRRLLLILILVSLAWGQLTRITLTPQIAFYLHDIFIVGYLLTGIPVIAKTISQPKYQKKLVAISSFWLFSIFSLWINQKLTLVPLAYLARLGLYLAIGVTLVWTRPYRKTEWQLLLATFFLALAVIGLIQYLCWPDTRLLQYLGWDDHYYRLIGTWFDPAFTGLGLGLGLIFILNYRKFFVSIAGKFCWLVWVLLLAVACLLTYSRSTYLGLAVTGLLFLSKKSICSSRFFHKKSILISFFIVIIVAIFFSIQAKRFPSDSTNLWRTNSIRVRWQAVQEQTRHWQWWQWLLGRGPFVSLPAPPNPKLVTGHKQTAIFPDNSLLLLISFWGVPLAAACIWCIGRCWWRLYQKNSVLAYYFVCAFVHSQFNQSLFQPFIMITLILLVNLEIFDSSRVTQL